MSTGQQGNALPGNGTETESGDLQRIGEVARGHATNGNGYDELRVAKPRSRKASK